jgi:hypothetical protein
MSHVKQKHDWDCVIASIAMMAGVEYNDVLKTYIKLYPKHQKSGLNDDEIFHILSQFGIRPKIIDAVVKNLSGIMFLPSKNDKGGSHAVYFTGDEIFDPNYRIKGKKYYAKKIPKKFPHGTQMVVDKNNPMSKNVLRKLKH